METIGREELITILPVLIRFEQALGDHPVGLKPAKHVFETIRAIKLVTEGLKLIENK